jgi:hypothetical protein
MWLALLLPVAQSAATWHAYSHFGADKVQRNDDPRSSHSASCDLCLAGAAIGSAGLPTTPGALPAPPARDALPSVAVVTRWVPPSTTGYLSRAPPLSRS